MELIDWGTAQRVGELVAGSPPPGGIRAAAVEPLAHDYARRVSEYSGLAEPSELPPLEVVDRPAWIAANLQSMRPLMASVTDRIEDGGGIFAGPLRAASGVLLGVQVGALTGVLSQRVLGQYDLALLDAAVPPRLLLLAPNLAQAARSLGVDREELVRWVTIHEVTHAVQFSGAPWLREHIGGLLRELLDGLQIAMAPQAGRSALRLPRLPDAGDLRDLVARAREGDLLRLTLGEDRWQLVQRMQSAMSLIEGHAEHTMDAVGAEVLPSLPRLRAAMTHRRETRGLPWRVLERLLGLELKMRQYETGRRFCDAVVADGGPPALALAFSGPQALPSAAELERPADWLARMRAA
ncbi:MAG TPA: zinc-dependent metalloprotease [Solirubrobacteraceae bacterium]|nr:zinc-dependent metalloprotease [Solirubrobacteraceae bacterium]